MKIKVDQEKCIGCGNCIGLTDGKVFDYNDDGLADTILDSIPEDLIEITEDSINSCPVEAIVEVEEDEK